MESDRFRKGKLNMKRPLLFAAWGFVLGEVYLRPADGLADPDPGASVQRGNGSVDEVE